MAAASIATVVLAPVLLVIAVSLLMTEGAPLLYRAQRAGRGGVPFTFLKFRTMRTSESSAVSSSITGAEDARIHGVGHVLRRFKLDELPQLLNVFRGEMSIVGPRPEDIDIVRRHYTEEMRATLDVKPGLASPGSIWSTAFADDMLRGDDPETLYLRSVLPVKLAIEQEYLARWSLLYDLKMIWRTLVAVIATVVGRPAWIHLPELSEAKRRIGETPEISDSGGHE